MSVSTKPCAVFWFRRDLRLEDNAGLYAALLGKHTVLPVFIFDTEILGRLPHDDARVTFIFNTLQNMRTELHSKFGSSLAIFFGKPVEIFKKICDQYHVHTVHTNRDYEPYALERDQQIAQLLSTRKVAFKTYKDQVIFERDEIVKEDTQPYVVYTPYKNRWKSVFNPQNHLPEYSLAPQSSNFVKTANLPNISLEAMGFTVSKIKFPHYNVSPLMIQNYADTRNFPGLGQGTSRLGPYLRFGTVSIRNMVKKAIAENNDVFFNELIWREFFMQILWHFPHTVQAAFKPKYDRIDWRNNEQEFELWKTGRTGYALVDAGMRELNATGFMHNRVRMLVASFLCKHLLIDWRWGEAYFAEKLLDYDQSANVGNWQWASGSGVDAAPYFRIFNPMTQIEKFDKQMLYIKKWVPELNKKEYPPMMVDHTFARERCLKTYKEALL